MLPYFCPVCVTLHTWTGEADCEHGLPSLHSLDTEKNLSFSSTRYSQTLDFTWQELPNPGLVTLTLVNDGKMDFIQGKPWRSVQRSLIREGEWTHRQLLKGLMEIHKQRVGRGQWKENF